MAFRRAVNETGYDPDKTLRYWVSPEFKLDVADGDPAKAVTRIRQAESLIATALGDGTNDEEFEEILSYLDADLRETAKQRRVDKR